MNKIHSGAGRAQHLCAAVQSGAAVAVLAVAADPRPGLERRGCGRYRDYKAKVPMLVPFLKRGGQKEQSKQVAPVRGVQLPARGQ